MWGPERLAVRTDFGTRDFETAPQLESGGLVAILPPRHRWSLKSSNREETRKGAADRHLPTGTLFTIHQGRLKWLFDAVGGVGVC